MESGCRQNCEYYSYDLVKMSKWMNSDPEYLGGLIDNNVDIHDSNHSKDFF